MHHQHHTRIPHSPLTKNSFAAPYTTLVQCVYVCVRMCVCVCENLWRARKLCATYAKSLPKDLQKNQKKNKFTCGDGHFALNVLFDKRAFQRAFGGPKSSVGYLEESAGVQGQVKAQLKHQVNERLSN